jgi:microcystin synthetase protein McyA
MSNQKYSRSENVFVALGADVTQALLTEVPKSFRTLTTDALLTALVEVFSHWTGRAELLVDIEGHGRDAFFKDTDLSHTIGCFSTIYPVVLNLSGKPNPGEVLMTVKEQLRQVPNGGIGYGVLRYMSGEDAVIRKLQELPQSELSFYYFGQLDNMLDPTSVFQLPDEFRLPKRNLLGNRRYLLEITSGIIHGQLMMNWTFNKDNYHRATIEKLASDYMDLLKNLIEHCNLPTAGRYTPSDFPEANLNQQELDDLLAEIDDL